jgi:hypothetical protein
MHSSRLVPIALAAALLAAAAPAANASQVAVERLGGTHLDAAPGEANKITITFRKGAFKVVDTGAALSGGRFCPRKPHHIVRCYPARAGEGGRLAPNLKVRLSDGNDAVTVKPAHRHGGTTLDGGAGNDVLRSGDGFVDGFLLGGSGDDTLIDGSRPDDLEGGPGRDVLSGGGGRDQMYGDEVGNGQVAPSEEDRLDGGDGPDVMNGGEGADVLIGGAGNDVLGGGTIEDEDPLFGRVDYGADTMDGGPGNDVLNGMDDRTAVVDHITCGPGNDRVAADQLDDVAPDCEQVTRTEIVDDGNPYN